MGLFDNDLQRLTESAMDAAWYKQQTISHNISNIDTPNYKAKNVDFGVIFDEEKNKFKYHQDHLYGLLDRDAPKLGVSTTYETSTNQTLNGNNVDMEKEALELADVQYQYSTLIDRMNNNYSMIRAALLR